jgi:hypothetical protein
MNHRGGPVMEPNAIAQFASVMDPDRPIGSLCALLVATRQASQDKAATAKIREILVSLKASADLWRAGARDETDYDYDEEETPHQPPL